MKNDDSMGCSGQAQCQDQIEERRGVVKNSKRQLSLPLT